MDTRDEGCVHLYTGLHFRLHFSSGTAIVRFGGIFEYLLTAQLVGIKRSGVEYFELSLSITRILKSLLEAF